MNFTEAGIANAKAHESLVAAWKNEASVSRRRRLRSLILKVELEQAVIAEKIEAGTASAYLPVPGNLVISIKDLLWARSCSSSFAVSAAHRASIVSWVTSIVERS
jgi:hypothetical protein